jgi:hypothetical protein
VVVVVQSLLLSSVSPHPAFPLHPGLPPQQDSPQVLPLLFTEASRPSPCPTSRTGNVPPSSADNLGTVYHPLQPEGRGLSQAPQLPGHREHV